MVEEKVEYILMKKKLLELKQTKIQRDVQLATSIARARDQVHWLGGFTAAMATTSVLKSAVFRAGHLGISQFPFLAVPTFLAYQYDLAYGSKMERIYKETRHILRNERHWFNEPMALPPYLEEPYRAMQDTHNAQLAALGRKPDKDWARFNPDMTEAEILDHTYGANKANIEIVNIDCL
eukprot:jgi/Bigna1/67583/fgenesh1_pg.4_\